MSSKAPSMAYKKSKLPQNFDYIEGSIKRFPDVLREQAGFFNYDDFATSRWQSRRKDRQSLGSRYGREAKFVMRNDPDMTELPAGRFWYVEKRQVIVVGLPGTNAADPPRYVMVYSPARHRIPTANNWTAIVWQVWKPDDRSVEYYEGTPDDILRVQAPETFSEDEETDTEDPVAADNSNQSNRVQISDAITPDPTPEKRQVLLLDMLSHSLKRNRSIEADPAASPVPKRSRDQVSDTTEEIQPSIEPDKNDLQLTTEAEKAKAVLDENKQLNKRSITIKQEARTTDAGYIAPQLSDSANQEFSSDTTSKLQIDRSVAAASNVTQPSMNVLRPSSGKIVIDLTVEDDTDFVRAAPNPILYVVFIDEHDQEQHKMCFDDCNTARQLFEEACAWEVANKDTRMLEVCITGCNPARISRDNEKHFEQKVLQPLKQMMDSQNGGKDVTLMVRKYM